MARESYDLQLKDLKDTMISLITTVEAVLQEAVSALVNQDVKKAKSVACGDDKVDAQVKSIEQKCMNILMLQQPVARDLREVSASIKMITDIERIGDNAADISELTVLMAGHPYADEIHLIEEISKNTTIMLIKAADAFSEADIKKAREVITMDDIVDAIFLDMKRSIVKTIRASEGGVEQELDLLLVAKYFERIGDHAVNIAEWIIFSITGEFPSKASQ